MYGNVYYFNTKVAYANGKNVIGKSVGTAVITAKCNGKSYQCKVVVTSGENKTVVADGVYTSKNKVALYIHTYGKLPSNFITKTEAKSLGWTGGSLLDVAPKKCIGRDNYSNYEKKLPMVEGRIYYECDINTLGTLDRGSFRYQRDCKPDSGCNPAVMEAIEGLRRVVQRFSGTSDVFSESVKYQKI